MPQSLVTDWKCVAQSGPTIDGRHIKPEWLTQMAETYDPAVYTARIWIDHMRWGSYGTVQAVKAEPHGELVKLFVKLSPSRSLLTLNQIYEEKMTFSIEVAENFAKTGKCYLAGLAMTDEPASLGTDELRFSRKGDREYTARLVGSSVPDLRKDFSEPNQAQTLLEKFFGFLQHHSNQPDDNQPDEEQEMDNKKFDALHASVTELGTAVAAIGEQLRTFTAKQQETKPAEPEVKPAEFAKSEEFATLHQTVTGLAEKLETMAVRLEEHKPGTQTPDTTGPAGGNADLL